MDQKIRSIDILARTIWGEARGEGIIGMSAVICVILNRVAHAKFSKNGQFWWGNDIQSVCLKPWQFSCWNRNDPNRQKLLSVDEKDSHFSQALTLATNAVEEGIEQDITRGADHYHTIYIRPFWAKDEEPICKIGHHLFYKLVD